MSVRGVDHLAVVSDEPLGMLRRTAAEKFSRSRAEIPEATVWVDVDATRLVELRAELARARRQAPGEPVRVRLGFERPLPRRVQLRAQLEQQGHFTLTPEQFGRIAGYGFQSGFSTHADRLATIRDTWTRFGTMIDTHTADGLKVAAEYREAGVPMIVLETALPVKFADTIVEALGRQPERPAALEGIEQLPKRFEAMPADAERVKQFIAAHA